MVNKVQKLNFSQKTENNGTTAAGRLSANEFNQIPAKIDELVDELNKVPDELKEIKDSIAEGTGGSTGGGHLQIGTEKGTAFEGDRGLKLEQDITGLKAAVQQALKKGELEGVQIDDLDDLMAYLRLNFKQSAEAGEMRFRIVNELPSTTITVQTGGKCEIAFSFVSQQYDGATWVTIPEWGSYSVQVKRAQDTAFTTAVSGSTQQGNVVRLDLSEFIGSGDWSVKVEVVGSDTGQKAQLNYAVTVTSMSLTADNFDWWTAKTGDFTIPFMVTGTIQKILHLTVTGANGYVRSYDENIGNATYTQTPKVMTIEHPGISGVYHIKAYLSNTTGSVQTQAVERDVMCVDEGEQVKLMVVNNVSTGLVNYTENTVFEYAIYDNGGAYTSVEFIAKLGNHVLADTGLMDRVLANALNVYTLPIEADDVAGDYFDITVSAQDAGGKLTEDMTFSVDNRMSYSAVGGAVMNMAVKTRNNAQANREMIVNDVDGSEIEATWSGLNWGNDGWVTDDAGRKTLRLMSGSSVEMDYRPFEVECSGTGKTVEIDFMVENVTDFAEPVIQIDNGGTGDSFVGVKIYPDNIIVHSAIKKDDSNQSLHIFEGKRTRLAITIVPNLYGVNGFNLCILYINGRKNREFEYSSSDYWRNNGTVRIGNNVADINIYGLRVYNSGLSAGEIHRNYINWLPDIEDKVLETADNDIQDETGNISFEKTVQKYNCLVFDQPFVSMADKTERDGTLEWYDHDHPENNVKITNVHLKGQGTTSMKYWTWNLGLQLKKTKINGVVQDSVITWVNQEGQPTATNKWAMNSEQPAAKKFVAKKNYASSMQSHKIGAVNSYSQLIREVGIENAEMKADAKVRVSVFEMPCFGFEKSVDDEGQYVYEFKGLYTFGSAKGDSATFAFDGDKNPELLVLEGADNSPLLALFRVPWKADSAYISHNDDEEAWQYNGANSFDDGEGSPDRIAKFLPAYNFVYECSPRLRPVAKTLAELNADKDSYSNIDYEVWCSKAGAEYGNVYYYERGAGGFLASDTGTGQINLITQLVGKGYRVTAKDGLGNDIQVALTQDMIAGKAASEVNTLLIEARIDKFRQEVAQYWNVDDTLLFMCNVELYAGTDERAKNTYPYTLGMAADGTWRWYVDDADTRFDTTNRGLPEKTYSVEMHDYETNDYTPVWNDAVLNYSDTITAGATAVWNGETNNLFNLIELAFAAEKTAMMKKHLDAMVSLGGSKRATTLEKLYDFVKKYFFDNAQEYFPAVGYNEDARISYEGGTMAYNDGRYSNDTHPITQSLGDHYLAEQRWITRRLVYMMSKYGYGLFAENGGDTIVFRASGNVIRYELTPAIDLYPTMGNGTTPVRGARTKAGEVCVIDIDLGGSADQQNTVYGVSWLLDIGDWHEKPVQGTMTVNGKMLRRLKLGDKEQNIIIAVTQLNIGDCVSLRMIDLRRISTLRGELNLTVCSHLKELYAGGTQLTNILLPVGGGIEKVEYPATEQYIVMKNFVLLENSGVNYMTCAQNVTTFLVSECGRMNPFAMLVDIMKAQETAGGDALQYVRCVGFDETFDSGNTLDYVAKLADTERYSGLNANGVATADTRVPVLEGRITVNGYVYEDSIQALFDVFDPAKLRIDVQGYWVRFADPEVLRILLAHYDTDGDGGLTQEEVAAITSLGTIFQNNKIIETFDELSKFSNVTSIIPYAFKGCSSLKSIDLTNIKTISTDGFVDHGPFYNCISLHDIKISNDLTNIGTGAFANTAIEEFEIPDSVTEIGTRAFFGTKIKRLKVNVPRVFEVADNPYLQLLDVGDKCTYFSSFKDLSNKVTLICRALVPPQLYISYNMRGLGDVYVPDGSVNAYKTATNWSNFAAKIKPLSEYVETNS